MAAVVYFTFKFYSFLRFSVLCTTIMTAMMSFSWVWLHKRMFSMKATSHTIHFLFPVKNGNSTSFCWHLQCYEKDILTETTNNNMFFYRFSFFFFCRFPWLFPSTLKDHNFCKEKEESLKKKKKQDKDGNFVNDLMISKIYGA